jgi:tRNA threonylcarbamoyladenosine biosynthesis protein TsaB
VLLGLTTTTIRGGVALIEGDVVMEETYAGETQHAERLLPAVDALLARAGRGRGDIRAIACDVGPGSFTGVRVGLATAKGMAIGLGVPLVPVRSLEAMAAAAFDARPDAAAVACLIDAKRGEVFYGVFERDGSERVPAGCAADVAPVLALVPHLVVCGLPAVVPALPRIDAAACALPSAAWIARLGRARLRTEPPLDAVEPVYLRAPDAKLPERA